MGGLTGQPESTELPREGPRELMDRRPVPPDRRASAQPWRQPALKTLRYRAFARQFGESDMHQVSLVGTSTMT
jgi:hypothetical protein